MAFPRLTLLFSSVTSGGVLWWVGWAICPKLLVAILSLGYWDTNPILVIGAWVWAFSGNDSNSKSSGSSGSSGYSGSSGSPVSYNPGPSFSPSFGIKNVTATGGIATAAKVISSIKIREKKRHSKCPYCHDDISSSVTNRSCGQCSAEHHRECWNELGSCSSCGSGY